MRRRTFVGALAAGAGAVTVLQPRLARARVVSLSLDKVAQLQTAGGSASLKVKDKPLLIVRDTEDSVRVFDPICTHKNCKVAFKKETGRIHCHCHDSAFDLEGKVLGGPAKQDLFRYKAKLRDNKVLIKLPEKA